MAKNIGDKSCQSNFDKWSSDFGSSLASYLTTTVTSMVSVQKSIVF